MSKPVARKPQPQRPRSQRPSELATAANDNAPEPTLRLAPATDPTADEGANFLLMELYAHIRALEAERSAQQG